MTTTVPQRGARYPVQMMLQARALHDSGWGLTRIQDLLERDFGPRPHHTTILRWIYPKHAKAQRRQAERWAKKRADDRRSHRMRALRAAGLTFEAVAAVMRLDGDDLSADQVRYALRDAASFRRDCVECGAEFERATNGRPALRCPSCRGVIA